MKKTHRITKTSFVKTLILLTVLVILKVTPASAFEVPIHKDITNTALTRSSTTVIDPTDGLILKFSPKAIEEIKEANGDTDTCFTCQFHAEYHFDDESFTESNNRLITLKKEIINLLTSDPYHPDASKARKKLGTALHTLQDFYAHSNWVELGNSNPNPTIGTPKFSVSPRTVPACTPNTSTYNTQLTTLTSGYFNILSYLIIFNPNFEGFEEMCNPPEWIAQGNCRHGYPYLPGCPSGLNKDKGDSVAGGSHEIAKSQAITATEIYVKQILDEILDNNSLTNKEKSIAIKSLMGVSGSLVIVIDVTTSMQGEIDAVKSSVTQIVNEVKISDDAPQDYILVTFGDPVSVGETVITSDPDYFLQAVNALTLIASTNADCPEYSLTGLLNAIYGSQTGTTIFVFTDANAKDSGLKNNVVKEAQEKDIRINFLVTSDSCSSAPVDPAYSYIATQTGGILYSSLNPSQLVSINNILIRKQLTGNLVPALLVDTSLTTQSFIIPLDSTVTNAIFTITGGVPASVVLTRPSGIPINANDADVKIVTLNSGTIITISQPTVGNWALQINGVGNFSIAVDVNSSLELNQFDFVELTKIQHESLLPIAGFPLTGIEQTGLSNLIGSYNTAQFKLLSQNGQIINTLNLSQNNAAAEADDFVGEFSLPSEPFRVAVSGLDSNGQPYQRLYPILFTAQTIEVKLDTLAALTSVSNFALGQTATFKFKVHNIGSSDTFMIAVTDNQNFVSRVAPSSLNLGTGATGIVEVDLTMPAKKPADEEISVTIAASSVSNPKTTNSAHLDLLAPPYKNYLPVVLK